MESIVAGSYDRFLFGYECSTSGQEQELYKLKKKFTHAAHKGHVKCLASSSPYIASGGADDLIHLYDLKAGTDLGFLISPGSGAVSALAWHAQPGEAPSHLFSGAADGGISVWQAGADWTCYKTLHSHKKEVSSLAVHSSGRLALSTSRDSTLRLWNLVKGKCVHTTTLQSSADQVSFAADGDTYAVLLDQTVSVHHVESGATPQQVLTHSTKFHCLSYFSPTAILTGTENGSVQLWDPRTSSDPVFTIAKAHRSRVKGMASFDNVSSSAPDFPSLVASASSDGKIRLWDMRKAQSSKSGGFSTVAEADTGARLTCLISMNLDTETKPAAKIKPRFIKETDKAVNHKAAQPEKDASQKKAKKDQRSTMAKAGIAHDGVVEFPDEDLDEKATGKAKKKVKQSKGKGNLSKRQRPDNLGGTKMISKS